MTTTEAKASILQRVVEILTAGGWHLAAYEVQRQCRPLCEPEDEESVDFGTLPGPDDTPTIKVRTT